MIVNENVKQRTLGDGIKREFEYEIHSNRQEDLTIVISDEAHNVFYLRNGIHYNFTAYNSFQGVVKYPLNDEEDPLPLGWMLSIVLKVDIKQLTRFGNKVYLPKIYDDAADLICLVSLSQQEELNRCTKLDQLSTEDFEVLTDQLMGGLDPSLVNPPSQLATKVYMDSFIDTNPELGLSIVAGASQKALKTYVDKMVDDSDDLNGYVGECSEWQTDLALDDKMPSQRAVRDFMTSRCVNPAWQTKEYAGAHNFTLIGAVPPLYEPVYIEYVTINVPALTFGVTPRFVNGTCVSNERYIANYMLAMSTPTELVFRIQMLNGAEQIIAGSYDMAVFAKETEFFVDKWAAPLPEPVKQYGAMCTDGAVIVCLLTNWGLVAIDMRSGLEKWRWVGTDDYDPLYPGGTTPDIPDTSHYGSTGTVSLKPSYISMLQGSPTYHDGYVYVHVRLYHTTAGASPNWSGVVAVDVVTGESDLMYWNEASHYATHTPAVNDDIIICGRYWGSQPTKIVGWIPGVSYPQHNKSIGGLPVQPPYAWLSNGTINYKEYDGIPILKKMDTAPYEGQTHYICSGSQGNIVVRSTGGVLKESFRYEYLNDFLEPDDLENGNNHIYWGASYENTSTSGGCVRKMMLRGSTSFEYPTEDGIAEGDWSQYWYLANLTLIGSYCSRYNAPRIGNYIVCGEMHIPNPGFRSLFLLTRGNVGASNDGTPIFGALSNIRPYGPFKGDEAKGEGGYCYFATVSWLGGDPTMMVCIDVDKTGRHVPYESWHPLYGTGNKRDGQEWKFPYLVWWEETNGTCYTMPILNGDYIYVCTASEEMLCYNRGTREAYQTEDHS